MSSHATAEGTARYAERHRAAPGHFTTFEELEISSIGIGTYLGDHDDETDRAYQNACERALTSGCNFIDTAINYRCQRSERAIGAALARLIERSEIARDEIVVATKGGYLPFDGTPPANLGEYVQERFVEPGLIGPGDLVDGSHCLAPRYLSAQIDWSLKNLGLESIDIYYLHNPESQLHEVSPAVFYDRLHAAFTLLEERAARGDIHFFGTATWDGLREEKGAPGHLDLSRIVALAQEVGGRDHHFRAIQLPHNLAMPEAFIRMNQTLDGTEVTTLEAAVHHGLLAVASASILQGNLASGLPEDLHQAFPGLTTDAQRSLEFTRSTPGVGAALVGMKSRQHVDENLQVLKHPRLTREDFIEQFTIAS